MDPLSNRRTFLKAAFGGVAGMSLSGMVPARAAGQAGVGSGISTTRLDERLFLLSGAGANVVAMTGSDGVVMVDGGLDENSRALLSTVSALPRGGSVRTLFNTHWHPEQTGSNRAVAREGARIIAHENTRLWLTTDITRPWENRTFEPIPAEALPNETFYTTGAMTLNDERIEYGYLLQAHTDGDIYVFFPESNVLVAGGVVSGEGWPLIDWWTGGWINGMVDGLQTLIDVADPDTRVVPADGPLLTRSDLETQHEMYRTISQRLRAIMYAGKSPDDAVAEAPTQEYNDRMGDPETFIRLAFQSMWGHLTPDA